MLYKSSCHYFLSFAPAACSQFRDQLSYESAHGSVRTSWIDLWGLVWNVTARVQDVKVVCLEVGRVPEGHGIWHEASEHGRACEAYAVFGLNSFVLLGPTVSFRVAGGTVR